jgi:hypothetical protein
VDLKLPGSPSPPEKENVKDADRETDMDLMEVIIS